MKQYKIDYIQGSGTYSSVYAAHSIQTGQKVAIKCIYNRFYNFEDALNNNQVQALQKLSKNENIINLIKILYDEEKNKLALVMQLMDTNLYEYMKSNRTKLNETKIKLYMYQLLKGISQIHKKGILHRDIKPENILIKENVLKLTDFGSCSNEDQQGQYTGYIATRWYRSIQCLLTDGYYDSKIDIWAFGCVLFEVYAQYPLFAGKSEIDQINKIINILGCPSQQFLAKLPIKQIYQSMDFPKKKGTGIQRLLLPHQTQLVDLLKKTLIYDHKLRISADEALQHQYFKDFQIKQPATVKINDNKIRKHSQCFKLNTNRIKINIQTPKYPIKSKNQSSKYTDNSNFPNNSLRLSWFYYKKQRLFNRLPKINKEQELLK